MQNKLVIFNTKPIKMSSVYHSWYLFFYIFSNEGPPTTTAKWTFVVFNSIQFNNERLNRNQKRENNIITNSVFILFFDFLFISTKRERIFLLCYFRFFMIFLFVCFSSVSVSQIALHFIQSQTKWMKERKILAALTKKIQTNDGIGRQYH